jgi:hypothetical protein
MFKQTLTSIRPNKDHPFFFDSPEFAEIQQMRGDLRESNSDLVLSKETILSEDELTFTNILTYPSKSAYNEYVALMKSTIPNWPAVRNDYYAAKGHELICEGQIGKLQPFLIFTL